MRHVLLRPSTRTVSSEKGTPATKMRCIKSSSTASSMGADMTGRNPMRSVRTRYVPGAAAGSRNSPRSFVSARAATLSEASSRKTTTPGTGRLSARSTTAPRMVCARASAGIANTAKSAKRSRTITLHPSIRACAPQARPARLSPRSPRSHGRRSPSEPSRPRPICAAAPPAARSVPQAPSCPRAPPR